MLGEGCLPPGGRLPSPPTAQRRRKTNWALKVGVGQPDTWVEGRSLLAVTSACQPVRTHWPWNTAEGSSGRVSQILAGAWPAPRLLVLRVAEPGLW